MSNEVDVIRDDASLQVLPPARPPIQSAQAILRAHAEMMDTAYHLAKAMCATTMVPDRFKGKSHDGAAAILYGAEIGLNPIQSLQRIIPIYGMPTLEARTMVALLKARGYKVKTLEQSDDQVTVEGYDLDGERYVSQWTIARAMKAGYVPTVDEKTGKYRLNVKGNLIGNEKYITDPQAMLKAKAQAEVCRDMAPEVLLGISYSREDLESEPADTFVSRGGNGQPGGGVITAEEILADIAEDQDEPGPVGGGMAADKGGQRPAANGTPPPPPTPPTAEDAARLIQQGAVIGRQDVTESPYGVPLTPPAEQMTPDVAEEEAAEAAAVAAEENRYRAELGEPEIYEHDPKQTRTLFAFLRKAGLDNTLANKPRRLAFFRFITGNPAINSTNHVTPQQLTEMVDTLRTWDKNKVLGRKVDEILLALVEDEKQPDTRA